VFGCLIVHEVNCFGFVQGFGTLLMEEAERIAREEHGSIKLAVISGKSIASILMDPPYV